MVYCVNKDCMFGGWFYLDCLGFEEDDVFDGNWWCLLVIWKEEESNSC